MSLVPQLTGVPELLSSAFKGSYQGTARSPGGGRDDRRALLHPVFDDDEDALPVVEASSGGIRRIGDMGYEPLLALDLHKLGLESGYPETRRAQNIPESRPVLPGVDLGRILRRKHVGYNRDNPEKADV